MLLVLIKSFDGFTTDTRVQVSTPAKVGGLLISIIIYSLLNNLYVSLNPVILRKDIDLDVGKLWKF